MSENNNRKEKPDKSTILSACGSIASLTALVVVLVDNGSKDPQMAIWRMVLALICLLIIGGIVVVEYDYLESIFSNNKYSLRIKAIKAVCSLVPALLLIALFLDGLFAAIKWNWWLRSLICHLQQLA